MIQLSKLIYYFDSISLTDDIIELEPATTILDQKKFLKTHINTLRSNSGNKRFRPYYDRLLKLYLIYNQKNNKKRL